jgi:hypothetical protein
MARRTKRPSSSRGYVDRRQAKARQFTVKSWALTAQAMGQRRDPTALLDLLGLFDWLGDRNLDAVLRHMPPLPCRAGCDFCCRVGLDRPDLLPPEVLRIAEFIRREESLSVQGMLERIVQARETAAAASEEKRKKLPCLFLEQDVCLIYPVRPIRCRAQHSHDAGACEAHFLGQRETMPLLTEPALLYKSLQVGLRLGLQQLGLADRRLPLTGALFVALSRANTLEHWLKGRDVFSEIALPDQPDERRALRRLARQAQHQAQAEKRRLGQLTSILAQQRGAWAQYTLSGDAPV